MVINGDVTEVLHPFVKLKKDKTQPEELFTVIYANNLFETHSHELQLPDGNSCLAKSKAPYHNSMYRISHAIQHCRNKPYLFTFVRSRFTPDCI